MIVGLFFCEFRSVLAVARQRRGEQIMSRSTAARLYSRFALCVLMFSLACGENGASLSSESGQGVAFAVPQDGTALSEPTLLAVVGDDIERVSFLLDGEAQLEVVSAPFEWNLLPDLYSAGVHVITVEAETDLGVESIQARITIVRPPPTTSIIRFERATPHQIGMVVPFGTAPLATAPPSVATATVRYRTSTVSTWRAVRRSVAGTVPDGRPDPRCITLLEASPCWRS